MLPDSVLLLSSVIMRSWFIGVATLWTVHAGSVRNAGSTSKNQFDVVMEPDTSSDPRPGEGIGGVSVLLKPSPEATTMKTWSLVKTSMAKIGDEVKKILSVRNDMSMLQQDLSEQQKLWKQAEVQLNGENAKLHAEMLALQSEVQAGAVVKRELMQVQQALEEQERNTTDLNNAAAMQEKKWNLQVQYLNNRKDNVTALHQEVNETASQEISRAEAVQLQLQKDAVTLRLAVGDFQDRLNNGMKKLEFENKKSADKQAELKRQLAAMQEGLIRIQGKLKPRSIFDEEEKKLKANLRKEVDTIISLQAENQRVVTGCTKEMQQKDTIKCAEDSKLKQRILEKTQFCNAIEVQNQVLKQDLGKCRSLTSVGEALAPASAPPGLIPPVPVRDEERLMSAPAPATAF